MSLPYQPTWPEFNPAEFIFADFNASQEKVKSVKKIILEIFFGCLFFVLFIYSLHLIDVRFNHEATPSPVFESNTNSQVQESERTYEYFQEGYVG